MAISFNNSIANIVGTPGAASGLFSNRPNAADVAEGTLYFSTDTFEIYQVVTSGWANYTNGGSTPTLQQVVTAGNTIVNSSIISSGISTSLQIDSDIIYIQDSNTSAQYSFDNINYTNVTSNNTVKLDFTIDSIFKTLYNGSGKGFLLDFASNVFTFGDHGNTNNGTIFQIDDNSTIIKTIFNTNDKGFKLDFSSNVFIFGDNSIGVNLDFNIQKYRFGDYDFGGANGINITIDDAAGTLATRVFANYDRGIFIDFNTSVYYFGDFDGFVNNTYIQVDDNNQKINLNSTAGSYSFSNVPTFANNAAALLGGLVVGDIYRVTGTGNMHIVF
jgi:hypothetical protein